MAGDPIWVGFGAAALAAAGLYFARRARRAAPKPGETPTIPRSTEAPAESERPHASVGEEPSWLVAMPRYVLALDVETTGLEDSDRIVSAGFILLNTRSLATEFVDLKINHLIFDPGRRSHPVAERIHGYRASVLAHQEAFSAELAEVCELIDASDLIVAHNADFDIRFLDRELTMAGRPLIAKPRFCTMTEWRERALTDSASLQAVARYLGLARRGGTHNAIEDAWLALRVYLLLRGCPIAVGFGPIAAAAGDPLNFHPVPDDEAPISGQHLADVMAAARRSGDYAAAEQFLLERITRTEGAARSSHVAVPFRAYGVMASIQRRQRRYAAEIEVLTRYCDIQGELGYPPALTATQRLSRARTLAERAGVTPLRL